MQRIKLFNGCMKDSRVMKQEKHLIEIVKNKDQTTTNSNTDR